MSRQHVDSLPADALEIPGYPKYFATPAGEILSTLQLKITRRRFGRNSGGYPICGMRHESGRLNFPMVHRIIARMFVAGDHSLTVNHIDMNKANCRADNLEWVTFSVNHVKDRQMKRGAWKSAGRRQPVIAINPENNEERRFESVREAALWAGHALASGNISKACRHRGLAYGFLWRKV